MMCTNPGGGSGSFLGKLVSMKKWIGPRGDMNKQNQDVIVPSPPTDTTHTTDATHTTPHTHPTHHTPHTTHAATHASHHATDLETYMVLLAERVSFLESQMADVLGILRAKQVTPRHRISQSRQTKQEFQDDSFFTARMSDHSNEVRQQNIMIRKNRPVPFKANHTTPEDSTAAPDDGNG